MARTCDVMYSLLTEQCGAVVAGMIHRGCSSGRRGATEKGGFVRVRARLFLLVFFAHAFLKNHLLRICPSSGLHLSLLRPSKAARSGSGGSGSGVGAAAAVASAVASEQQQRQWRRCSREAVGAADGSGVGALRLAAAVASVQQQWWQLQRPPWGAAGASDALAASEPRWHVLVRLAASACIA